MTESQKRILLAGARRLWPEQTPLKLSRTRAGPPNRYQLHVEAKRPDQTASRVVLAVCWLDTDGCPVYKLPDGSLQLCGLPGLYKDEPRTCGKCGSEIPQPGPCPTCDDAPFRRGR